MLTTGSGEATHTLAKASPPGNTAAVTDPGHDHAVTGGTIASSSQTRAGGGGQPILNVPTAIDITPATTGITVGVTADAGNGAP